MKQYREWSLASLFVCLFFLCGCDSTSMKDVAVSSPEILSFSPESGSIGSEIVVTGEYLDDVVSATIGGGKAVILQKVSNRRLSLKVTNQARSGKIVLVNSIGEGVSEGDFTLEYPAPQFAPVSGAGRCKSPQSRRHAAPGPLPWLRGHGRPGRAWQSEPGSSFHSSQSTSIGRYSPNTLRSSPQISPSVQYTLAQSRI